VMKNIYLYGASDDCMEAETDFGKQCESYVGIMINDVQVHYVFDGDWGLWLEGKIPQTWKVKSVYGNCATEARKKPFGGQFIHIQIPEDEDIKFVELKEPSHEN